MLGFFPHYNSTFLFHVGRYDHAHCFLFGFVKTAQQCHRGGEIAEVSDASAQITADVQGDFIHFNISHPFLTQPIHATNSGGVLLLARSSEAPAHFFALQNFYFFCHLVFSSALFSGIGVLENNVRVFSLLEHWLKTNLRVVCHSIFHSNRDLCASPTACGSFSSFHVFHQTSPDPPKLCPVAMTRNSYESDAMCILKK